MSKNKKYAENLIGNWEKDQFSPQKEAARASYETNWKDISNQFNDLKNRLERNQANARTNYANALGDIQDSSFNRMQNANADLAMRGLTGSGVGDLYTQADIRQKGEDVDKALSSLMNLTEENVGGLAKGVDTLTAKQNDLGNDLSGALAGIGDAERENAQQYANLVAGIAEGKDGRDARNASRSSSGGGGLKKKQEENDELYRRLGIMRTLDDNSLSEEQKRIILTQDYDLDIGGTNAALDSITYNRLKDDLSGATDRLNRAKGKEDSINKLGLYTMPISPLNPLVAKEYNYYNIKNKQNKVDKLNKELSKYSYTDLYDILNK